MRVEKINGRYLLAGHVLPEYQIRPGQVWAHADEAHELVTVIRIHFGVVTYQGSTPWSFENTKGVFAFQSRYRLVLENEEIPQEFTA